MNHRFFTKYLALLFFTDVAVAADNAWNCEQGQNGEWTCLNQKPTTAEQAQPKVISTQSPKAPEQSKPSAIVATPAEVKSAPVQAEVQEITPQPITPPVAERSIPQIQPPAVEEATVITASPIVEEAVGPATATPQLVQPTTQAQAAPETAVKLPKTLHAKIAENQLPVIEKAPARNEAPAQVAKNPGWSCNSGDEKDNWNCNLVGPDPKGQDQIVEASEASAFWFTPTYNHQQEQTFQALRSEFEQDPWQNCSSWSAKKNEIKTTPKEVRDSANTDIIADSSEVYDGEILSFAGNIDLRRADQHLLSDKASYDTVAETMDAQGNVIYSEAALAMSSDTASLSMGKDEARMRKAQFIAADAPLRGSADVMYRDSKSLSRYHEATFTSCPPGNQDWIAHASRLKINRESGLGSAKNAWLEFKGAPVMYIPYISFPVDNRRTSGLLAPTWGSTQRNGFDVTAPFYWNIAPNVDTTITPRYMEKRGFMLRNKLRYLTEKSYGSLGTEVLPYDELENKARYSATFQDRTRFTPHLSSIANLNYVSDEEYFNDMNNALGFQTNRFLPSLATVNYNRQDILFSTGINHYQSVDKTINKVDMPYDMLPRVNLNLNHSFENTPLPLTLEMPNQYTHFYRDVTDSVTGQSLKVNGQRFSTAPSVSLPMEASAGFLIPKVTGQYTQYQLSDQTDAGMTFGQSDSISRVLPIFSVDGGMMFEKELDIGGSGFTHTLEPRAFYLYIPRVNQNDIPLFDTSAYDTNFYSLFRENRFSGGDRIQDANQITLAGTTRLIDAKSGLEPVKLSFGQIIYFQDRKVDLDYLHDNRAPETSTTSNFVGEVSGQFTKHLSYMTGAQWDPLANGFARTQAVLKYRNQPDQIFDVGYRWRNDNQNDLAPQSQISQSDVSFRWPIAAGWYGLGRWQYSFNFDKTTESFVGVEKENCCWRFRIIGRRYINGATTTNFLAPDAKAENALFVQLELKGLTSFGNSVDQFLQQNLPGYRPSDYFDD